jgi:hypothetical protein
MVGPEEVRLVTDQVYRRRRESDRAEQLAALAAKRGDHAGYVMAIAQAEAARQRRDEWAKRGAGTG